MFNTAVKIWLANVMYLIMIDVNSTATSSVMRWLVLVAGFRAPDTTKRFGQVKRRVMPTYSPSIDLPLWLSIQPKRSSEDVPKHECHQYETRRLAKFDFRA